MPSVSTHRLVLAAVIYTIDIVALVSAFVIVKLTTTLVATTVVIIVIGFAVFMFLTYQGGRMLQALEDADESGDTEADVENGSVNRAFSDDGDLSVALAEGDEKPAEVSKGDQ